MDNQDADANQKQLERAVESYDFEDTVFEKACFRGGPSPPPSLEQIPKIVHFTWALKPSGSELPFLGYLAIRCALVSLRPLVVKLHHSYLNEENEYWQRLKDTVVLVRHEPNVQDIHVAHKSDLLRLELLRTEGGVYLDMDAYALRSFDNLLRSTHDMVLGHEGGNRWGLCNAVMLARPGSRFLQRWISSYANFDANHWNYHSVLLPKEMAARHPGEVSTLSPTVFFWPTWTFKHITYMHEALTEVEANEVQDQLDRYGGVLYENQLAYHAWSQMAHDRYLKFLTPEIMRTRDTRFNMLMRRFLD